MFLRNAVVSSCASSCLRASKPGAWAITSSRLGNLGVSTPNPRPPAIEARRCYATVASDDEAAHLAQRLAAWPKSPKPTPYEVFGQTAGAPYSKARFYELVKLYHPDRYCHHDDATAHNDNGLHRRAGGGLSRATKLERYRLVVAANNILCDPIKRRQYDMCGAGWGEAIGSDSGPSVDEARAAARARDKAWRSDPNSAANNATWEDWERWYQRQNGGGTGEKQMPVFMSNGGFVMIICAFAVVGMWAQAAQATARSANMMQARDQTHHIISRDMDYRRMEQATLSKEARVQYFLKQREGWGYDGYPDHMGHLPSGPTKS